MACPTHPAHSKCTGRARRGRTVASIIFGKLPRLCQRKCAQIGLSGLGTAQGWSCDRPRTFSRFQVGTSCSSSRCKTRFEDGEMQTEESFIPKAQAGPVLLCPEGRRGRTQPPVSCSGYC